MLISLDFNSQKELQEFSFLQYPVTPLLLFCCDNTYEILTFNAYFLVFRKERPILGDDPKVHFSGKVKSGGFHMKST